MNNWKDIKQKLVNEWREKNPEEAKKELKTAEAIRNVAQVGTQFVYSFTIRPVVYIVLEISVRGIRFRESDEGKESFMTWEEIDDECEAMGGLFLLES